MQTNVHNCKQMQTNVKHVNKCKRKKFKQMQTNVNKCKLVNKC